jgi:hypothetical protein
MDSQSHGDIERRMPFPIVPVIAIGTACFLVGYILGYTVGIKAIVTRTKVAPSPQVTASPTPSPSKPFAGWPTLAPRPTVKIEPTRIVGEKPQILARNYSYNDGSLVFSFQHPKPDYCQGCYDGNAWNNNFNGEIINQASDYGQTGNEDWIIYYAVFLDDGKHHAGGWSTISADFMKETEKLSVGDSVTLTEDLGDHPVYTITRMADMTVAGQPDRVYTSSWNNGIPEGKTKYAVFKKDGYIYILSSTWSPSHNDYIFDLVTSSFQFSLRPKSEVTSY